MQLLEHPLSSYVQKVKITLREKGIAFTTEIRRTAAPAVVVVRSRSQPSYRSAGADRRTARIFVSTVIMEYIDERWPSRRCCLPIRRLARSDASPRIFAAHA